MSGLSIYKDCQSCRGTGERQDSEENPTGICSFCLGEGKILVFVAPDFNPLELESRLSNIESVLDQILSTLPSVCKHPGGGDFG